MRAHGSSCAPASLAQWIERPPPKRQVAGSIPAGGTSFPGGPLAGAARLFQDLAEKRPQALVVRRIEEALWFVLIDHFTGIHEDDAIGDGARKTDRKSTRMNSSN